MLDKNFCDEGGHYDAEAAVPPCDHPNDFFPYPPGAIWGTLIQIKSNHNDIRTPETKGWTMFNPEVGEHFILIGESLGFKGGLRFIVTTRVTMVEWLVDTDIIRFTTANSMYEWHRD